MTVARRQSSLPPVHRLTVPAGPVDGANARGKMQGKIKGRGTRPLENPVCTWGWRGTLNPGHRAARARNAAWALAKVRACHGQQAVRGGSQALQASSTFTC